MSKVRTTEPEGIHRPRGGEAAEEEDVEGHGHKARAVEDEPIEGVHRPRDGEAEEDVEGHGHKARAVEDEDVEAHAHKVK
jgi:hypothetical protein